MAFFSPCTSVTALYPSSDFCLTRQDKNKERQPHLSNNWTNLLNITVKRMDDGDLQLAWGKGPLALAWRSLVVGDEGWIGPRKKLLCLC